MDSIYGIGEKVAAAVVVMLVLPYEQHFSMYPTTQQQACWAVTHTNTNMNSNVNINTHADSNSDVKSGAAGARVGAGDVSMAMAMVLCCPGSVSAMHSCCLRCSVR